MHRKQIFLVVANTALPVCAEGENVESVKEMNFWALSLKKEQKQGQNQLEELTASIRE